MCVHVIAVDIYSPNFKMWSVLVLFLSRFQVLLLLVNFCVSACYFSENVHVCSSVAELQAEGDSGWTKIMVVPTSSNNVPPHLTLAADSFSKTPDVVELSVRGLFSAVEGRAFDGLAKLDKLTMFNNDLQSFSPEMFIGINPRFVQLTRNNIKELPIGLFKHIPRVRNVHVSINSIPVLKAGIFNGMGIVNLYLQDNGFESIEERALADMPNLRLLLLPGNRLTSFDTKLILDQSTSLYSLTLSKNNIDVLKGDMLAGTPFLEQFLIQFNNIHTIEKELLYSVPQLEFLELGNNALREFPKEIFPKRGLPKLKVLFLHNNELTFLDLAVFPRMRNLQYMTLTGNPFQCRCLKELNTFLEELKVHVICTEDFYKDGRPHCLVSPVSNNTCIYDVKLNEQLITDYRHELANYSSVGPVCNTDAGFLTGKLVHKTY